MTAETDEVLGRLADVAGVTDAVAHHLAAALDATDRAEHPRLAATLIDAVRHAAAELVRVEARLADLAELVAR